MSEPVKPERQIEFEENMTAEEREDTVRFGEPPVPPTEPDLCGESDSDYRDRLLSAYPSGALASEIAEADTEGLDAAGGVLGMRRGPTEPDESPTLCGESVRLVEFGTCANPKPCPMHDDDAPAPTVTVAQASTSAIAELCLKCKHTRFWYTGTPAKLRKEPHCRCTCVWAESEPSEPPAEPQPCESAAAWMDRVGTDAREWSREFIRIFGNRSDEIDEALMIGWFANAIEAGRSAGHADQCEELERVKHACVVWKARDEAWHSDIQWNRDPVVPTDHDEPERSDPPAEPIQCSACDAYPEVRCPVHWNSPAEPKPEIAYADQREELERVKANLYAESLRGDALCKRLATLREETDRVDMSWHDAIHKIAGDLHPNALLFNGKSTLLDMLGSGIARLRERIAALEKEAAAFESAVIIYKGEDRTLRSIFDDGECREVCKLCKDPECRDFDCEIPDPPDRETFENR